MSLDLETVLADLPLVAILRGVRPDEVVAVSEAAFAAGFRLIEVPLNSPDPLESIARLARTFEGRALVGAGTVLTPAAVDSVHAAGVSVRGRVKASEDDVPTESWVDHIVKWPNRPARAKK